MFVVWFKKNTSWKFAGAFSTEQSALRFARRLKGEVFIQDPDGGSV